LLECYIKVYVCIILIMDIDLAFNAAEIIFNGVKKPLLIIIMHYT